VGGRKWYFLRTGSTGPYFIGEQAMDTYIDPWCMLTCTRHNKYFFNLHPTWPSSSEYILACPEMGQIAASRLSAKARVDKPRSKQQTTNLTSAGFTQHFVYPNQTKPKLIANRSILLSILGYPCGSVIVRGRQLSGITEFKTSTTEIFKHGK
jgi:hypothetical protein